MLVAFANAKATHIFFNKNNSIYIYATSNEQSFNYMLTKNILSLEQLSPDEVTNRW